MSAHFLGYVLGHAGTWRYNLKVMALAAEVVSTVDDDDANAAPNIGCELPLTGKGVVDERGKGGEGLGKNEPFGDM